MAKRDAIGTTVVETNAFRDQAKSRMKQEEVNELISLVAREPTRGAIIQGTGGVRKLRFGTQGRGKSSGVRVIYYYHSVRIPLFLLSVYAKSEKDNLTKAEKNELRQLVDILVNTYGVK